MKEKYEKPSMTVLPLNLEENIAASAGREEEYEIRITRNGQEIVVENGGFGTLDELCEWFRHFFDKK